MAKRPASRFPFTIERLRALKPPAKGCVYHYDTKTMGLCLCASSSGRKTFYWPRGANGKPLLPVQIVVQIARWPAHRVSPKSAVVQRFSIHDLTSMDLPDAYGSDELSGF